MASTLMGVMFVTGVDGVLDRLNAACALLVRRYGVPHVLREVLNQGIPAGAAWGG